MMSSTFPITKSNEHIKNGIRDIQKKKEALKVLEALLKKKITELKELCLKEGELTGQLPADYPLQPREPIPPIRRRAHMSAISQQQQQQQQQLQQQQPQKPHLQRQLQQQQQQQPQPQQPHPRHNHVKNFNINGVGNFQPYYEETKPFQMSDFYKYSTKYRQKLNETQEPVFKTTRQLQNDVLKSNSIRFSSYDDQFQASVKLIEKSGQKLIEATAKAIAGNPSLAEKLNNILPNNGGGY